MKNVHNLFGKTCRERTNQTGDLAVRTRQWTFWVSSKGREFLEKLTKMLCYMQRVSWRLSPIKATGGDCKSFNYLTNFNPRFHDNKATSFVWFNGRFHSSHTLRCEKPPRNVSKANYCTPAWYHPALTSYITFRLNEYNLTPCYYAGWRSFIYWEWRRTSLGGTLLEYKHITSFFLRMATSFISATPSGTQGTSPQKVSRGTIKERYVQPVRHVQGSKDNIKLDLWRWGMDLFPDSMLGSSGNCNMTSGTTSYREFIDQVSN